MPNPSDCCVVRCCRAPVVTCVRSDHIMSNRGANASARDVGVLVGAALRAVALAHAPRRTIAAVARSAIAAGAAALRPASPRAPAAVPDEDCHSYDAAATAVPSPAKAARRRRRRVRLLAAQARVDTDAEVAAPGVAPAADVDAAVPQPMDEDGDAACLLPASDCAAIGAVACPATRGGSRGSTEYY